MQVMKRSVQMLFLAACITAAVASQAMAAKDIVVGGKNYTEQYILSELSKQLLTSKGFNVTVKNGVGSSIVRKSLETAQIDFYFEYTGTAYTVYYKSKDPEIMNNSQKVYDFVKGKDAEKGLLWLNKAPFNNTYTLMMRKSQAADENIRTISDLAEKYKKDKNAYKLAVDAEFWERPDGIRKLMQIYGFRASNSQIKKMTLGITYLALKNKQVDVAMGFSTDGRIPRFNLVNLVDDMSFFPVYNPAPVVRAETLKKYPELEGILNGLTDKITSEEMQALNARVDVEHASVEETATAWLKEKKLL